MKAKKIEIDGQIYDFADMELQAQTQALETTVNTQHTPKIATLEQTVDTQHTPKIATLEQTVNTNHENRITALENKPPAGIWDSSIEQNIPFTIKSFRAYSNNLYGSSQLVQVKKSGTKLFIQIDGFVSYTLRAGQTQPSYIHASGVILEINAPIQDAKIIAEHTKVELEEEITNWPTFSQLKIQKKAGEETTKSEITISIYFMPKTQTEETAIDIGMELTVIIDTFQNKTVVIASAIYDL